MDPLVILRQYEVSCQLAVVKTDSFLIIGQHLQHKARPQPRHRNDIHLPVN